jgi:hypothetical protein
VVRDFSPRGLAEILFAETEIKMNEVVAAGKMPQVAEVRESGYGKTPTTIEVPPHGARISTLGRDSHPQRRITALLVAVTFLSGVVLFFLGVIGEYVGPIYEENKAGHVRRYSLRSLRESLRRNGLETIEDTYWGFPLVPTLLARKFWLHGMREESMVIKTGFDPGNPLLNSVLGVLSRCELIPQKSLGTSLMAMSEVKGASA